MVANNDNKRQPSPDEDIARMRSDFKMGRFTSDFDGMDAMTIMKRVEYIRHRLYEDKCRLPQNAHRLVNDIMLETDREDFYPNVHIICEKMLASSESRFKSAQSAFASARSGNNVRPGKKAVRMRRAIDAKYETVVSKQLSEEKKKIDAQKKEMEKYIKMAPDSSYAAMIVNIIKQNEVGYQLLSQQLSLQATVEKYERYEKRGVLVEQEKKLCILAKEAQRAAELRLTNHKQSAYILQERDALLRFDNQTLMKQAHAALLNCDKDPSPFMAIPKEMTERILEHGLMECESKYYTALQAKRDLVGFHPFKKMALDRELRQIAREYNAGLALLSDTCENKLKHPPLTTLEEWKKQNSIPQEKMAESNEELVEEFPVERMEEEPEEKKTIQLDLGDKIHTHRVTAEPVFKKETIVEKKPPKSEKEL